MTAVPCEWAVVLRTLLLVSGGDTSEESSLWPAFSSGSLIKPSHVPGQVPCNTNSMGQERWL